MTSIPDQPKASMTESSVSPLAYYATREAERRQSCAHWRRRDSAMASLRLLTFGLGVGLGTALLLDVSAWGHKLTPLWLGVPTLVFVVLVFVHDRVVRQRTQAERALAYYENAQQHLSGQWRESSNRGERDFPRDHPYAADIDLYGPNSLFQRLAHTQTHTGNRSLANLLSRPPSLLLAQARQAAIQSLTERVSLREDLYVAAAHTDRDATADALAWANQSRRAPRAFHHGAGAALSAASMLLLWAAYTERIAWFSGLAALGVQMLYGVWMRQRLAETRSRAEKSAAAIRALLAMMERLEREKFDAPLLQTQQARLCRTERRASHEIRQLLRFMEWEEGRRNLFFAPLAGLLLWGTQFAIAIERWRERVGPAMNDWLEAVGELEAYCSIAAYAFERPKDVYPKFCEGSVYLRAAGLAHPLIDAQKATRNDLELSADTPLWVISGSNMSGKSTWLRTIGINSVLAWIGAPVCAQEMHLSEFRLGASLRVQDSLADGESRFYAEIARIHTLMGLAEREAPLLFLLDEILAGTNSHDRALGAAAILRELLRLGAMGLVTTHDLALTQLADEWGAQARNWHFSDHLEQGRLVFDYRLKPGVVARSNAIELMQAVGLNVSRDENMSPESMLVHPKTARNC